MLHPCAIKPECSCTDHQEQERRTWSWEIIVSDGFGCFAAWPAISGQLKIDKSVYIGLAFGAGVRLVFIYTAIAWPALPLTR